MYLIQVAAMSAAAGWPAWGSPAWLTWMAGLACLAGRVLRALSVVAGWRACLAGWLAGKQLTYS